MDKTGTEARAGEKANLGGVDLALSAAEEPDGPAAQFRASAGVNNDL